MVRSMSGSLVLVLVVAAGWITVGLLAALWLARSGHDPRWTGIAVALGPLFVPIALELRNPRSSRVTAGGADPLGGPVVGAEGLRVLVGFDGSPESEEALRTAVAVAADRCAVLVLAQVLSHEVADDAGAVAAARAALGAVTAAVPDMPVTYEVLAGPPAEALREFAEESNMDLIVVGRRGRGASTRMLGSVASALTHRSGVPVLVAGRGGGREARWAGSGVDGVATNR